MTQRIDLLMSCALPVLMRIFCNNYVHHDGVCAACWPVSSKTYRMLCPLIPP